jgi:prolyl-tRNA editing enzyme YbaK/EbsC (Cys-tRNA(Pro) deacylase)
VTDKSNGAVATATPAIHFLRKHNVAFTAHTYRYEEHGGTRVSARELGVDEHMVIKTLVMEDESREPLIVLMHGDREVSTRQLSRQAGRAAIFAHVSLSDTVRLNTVAPGRESPSTAK